MEKVFMLSELWAANLILLIIVMPLSLFFITMFLVVWILYFLCEIHLALGVLAAVALVVLRHLNLHYKVVGPEYHIRYKVYPCEKYLLSAREYYMRVSWQRDDSESEEPRCVLCVPYLILMGLHLTVLSYFYANWCNHYLGPSYPYTQMGQADDRDDLWIREGLLKFAWEWPANIGLVIGVLYVIAVFVSALDVPLT